MRSAESPNAQARRGGNNEAKDHRTTTTAPAAGGGMVQPLPKLPNIEADRLFLKVHREVRADLLKEFHADQALSENEPCLGAASPEDHCSHKRGKLNLLCLGDVASFVSLPARGPGAPPGVLTPASVQKHKAPGLRPQAPGAVATGPSFVPPIHPTPLPVVPPHPARAKRRPEYQKPGAGSMALGAGAPLEAGRSRLDALQAVQRPKLKVQSRGGAYPVQFAPFNRGLTILRRSCILVNVLGAGTA